MSNPFLEPGSILVEQERKRRERFKVSVYVGLGAMTVFLLGLLIEGCQRADTPSVTSNSNPTDSNAPTNALADTGASTNGAIPLPTQPAAITAGAESNPPVVSAAVAPASNAPAVETVANVTPAQPSVATNDNPTAEAKEEIYVIKSGDTLSRIAKDHHTTVQAIKAANGLKTDRILAGKKLKLPAATTPTPAATGI